MLPKTRIRASPVRTHALRMLVAGAVVPALVVGPTVTLSAKGDDPESVDTSMQKVTVDGISPEAATETRNVAYNAPPTAQHSQVSAVLSESPHDEVEPDDDDLVALTEKEDTQDFSALGVTWESEQKPVEVWVRTKTAPTTWSNWEYVPSSQDHAPDPGSSEAGQTRAGTDPLMVPESDGVQVRVEAKDGTAPTGMEVNLIDPKQAGQDAELDQKAVPPGNATAAAIKPDIITRAQWGADESLRRQDPQYGTVRGGFVHHTASTNNYSADQVAGQLRSIYTYHVQGRGWNDIGYNYLVDKYGRIFEGRYGGVDKAVVGAHTGGYNSQSFAMSALGDYQNGGQPTAAMVNSYAKLYAWKLGQHEVDPSSSVTIYGRQFDTISGHRNAMSTSCPGDALYAQLPKIRQQAQALQGSSAPAPTAPPATEAPAPTPKPTPTVKPKPSSSGTVKHTLRRGSPYRDEVRLLQRKLGITADGVFGSGTEAAVKRYQSSKRLGADGIAGPNTLRAMGLYGTTSTPVTKPVTPKPKPKPTAEPKPSTNPSSSAKVKHTLRRGSPYRDEVRLMQRKLGITADGVFGSGTEAAVKRYQRSKRLGADGIAGPNTLRTMGLYGTTSAAKPATPKPKPTSKPKPSTKPSSSAKVKHTLRRGSPYRSEVRLLQRKLRISADGIFGSGTEAAVKRYQRSKRLGSDGIAGPNTLRALGLR